MYISTNCMPHMHGISLVWIVLMCMSLVRTVSSYLGSDCVIDVFIDIL